MTGIVQAIIAIAKAYEAYCKTYKFKELRELRNEQAATRLAIIANSRTGNSSAVDELQNQLSASYADSNALRDAGSDKGGEGN